jgi:hypothetical protein
MDGSLAATKIVLRAGRVQVVDKKSNFLSYDSS